MTSTSGENVTCLHELRQHVLEQLTSLLTTRSRSDIFADAIGTLILETHAEMIARLRQNLGKFHDDAVAAALTQLELHYAQFQDCLAILFSQQRRQRSDDTNSLSKLLFAVDQTAQDLSQNLVSKELLDRQSRMLENILLSQELIHQWDGFAEKILSDLHTLFPFNFFLVVMAEEYGVVLYLYCIGDYKNKAGQQARQHVIKQFFAQLGLPEHTQPDIIEYQLPGTQPRGSMSDIRIVSLSIPEHTPKLAGLLGAAFATTNPLTPQETRIIRSILSVIVTAVSSSKVLNRSCMELEYYAVHDPLTGLYNRRHFNELGEYELSRSHRHQHEFSILQLDLDDFKRINDTYGYSCGDSVLRQLGEILRKRLRKGDTLTRFGGDEFAILLPETSLAGGRKVAKTLHEVLNETRFESPNGSVFGITTSIGVINYPHDAKTFSDLLSGADVALYNAKKSGKNTTGVLDTTAKPCYASHDVRAMAEKLRLALRENRILPYFQPIVSCKSQKILGYEVLARVFEPSGETIPANLFLDAAEKYRLVLELDRAIIHGALTAKKKQTEEGKNNPRLFINLSAQQFHKQGILEFALELCDRMRMPPRDLVFELAEQDIIGNVTAMRNFIEELRNKGFAFALDNFGSGYNSLHYLHELYFEYVKIDGHLVRNILRSRVDYALVEHLARLCANLGIQTVAEYIESKALLTEASKLGINYAQGFHVGQPSATFRFNAKAAVLR